MDVHIFAISDHGSHSTQHPAQHSAQSIINIDIEDMLDKDNCGNLGGHCSHISSHLSGIVSSITFPFLESQSIFSFTVNNNPILYTQSPPRRPPKT
jgi:hypothetical protein